MILSVCARDHLTTTNTCARQHQHRYQISDTRYQISDIKWLNFFLPTLICLFAHGNSVILRVSFIQFVLGSSFSKCDGVPWRTDDRPLVTSNHTGPLI